MSSPVEIGFALKKNPKPEPSGKKGQRMDWLEQPHLSTLTIPWGAPEVKGPPQSEL